MRNALQSPPPEESMHREEQVSYVMLFCALLLVKNSKATVEQLVTIVPLFGRVKYLAGEMISRMPASDAPPAFPA